MMKVRLTVEQAFGDIVKDHDKVTTNDVVHLKKVAERVNEAGAGWCCTDVGTEGTEALRRIVLAPENQDKFSGVKDELAEYFRLYGASQK